MLNRTAEQFLYVLDQFIDRQISCTHPIVSAEVELMLDWRKRCLQLKFSKEEWKTEIPILIKRIIDDLNDNLALLKMDDDRYQAGLSIGAPYVPIVEQLDQLRHSISGDNERKDKGKEKEQEQQPLDNAKISLLRLVLLEKIKAAQFNLCYYVNSRVCRNSIFHRPKMNFDLLTDYNRLSAVIDGLDALTKAKVNHAINLMDELRALEREINEDSNDSVKHLRQFQQRFNQLFDDSINENKGIEKNIRILPYLPCMSSGYERVLEGSKFSKRIF